MASDTLIVPSSPNTGSLSELYRVRDFLLPVAALTSISSFGFNLLLVQVNRLVESKQRIPTHLVAVLSIFPSSR